MPAVSVVIPAFNAGSTLGAAVESVFAQSHPASEIIVIDDGSSDNTASVAAGYGSSVACIRTENRGVSRARNVGIQQATGELVAFLDADDLWKPEKLERQVAMLNHRDEAGICTTGCHRVNDDLDIIEDVPARSFADPCEALLMHSMALGQVSSPVVRRKLALDIGGFDAALSQGADWDFFIRLALITNFAVIPDPLVLYRVSSGNMSRDISLLEHDTFAVLDKFFQRKEARRYLPLRRRCYSNHWMILSGSYLEARKWWAAVRCLWEGLRLHPPNVRRPLGFPLRRLRRTSVFRRRQVSGDR